MKEQQKIYIRGSKDRPNDVRKILEQHGGKVDKVTNFTSSDCIYFINHDGNIDCAFVDSELYKIITEYYQEFKLTNSSKSWKAGDILVNDEDSNKFYIFDRYANDESIFVYLEINKSPTEDKASRINEIYHLIPYTPSHKADDKELKTFYSILVARNSTWDAYSNLLLPGNDTYFYPKNRHYYFRRNTIRCKDRTTGEWYDAVLYSDANGQYAREVNDFNNKFKKVII